MPFGISLLSPPYSGPHAGSMAGLPMRLSGRIQKGPESHTMSLDSTDTLAVGWRLSA